MEINEIVPKLEEATEKLVKLYEKQYKLSVEVDAKREAWDKAYNDFVMHESEFEAPGGRWNDSKRDAFVKEMNADLWRELRNAENALEKTSMQLRVANTVFTSLKYTIRFHEAMSRIAQ